MKVSELHSAMVSLLTLLVLTITQIPASAQLIGPGEDIADGPFNRPPVAADDTYTFTTSVILPGELPPIPIIYPTFANILDNDFDADGDPLTVISYTTPTHGYLDVHSSGVISYEPIPGIGGIVDTWTYTVSDDKGATSDATVYFILELITPENTDPVANDDTYSTTENEPISVSAPGVLANDGDEQGDAIYVASQGGQSVRGTLTLVADGSFTYTPKPGFWGIDTYTYRIVDTKGGEATASITFEVAALNLPPVANIWLSNPSPTVDDTLQFDSFLSYDPDGVIVAYDWDFGDGSTGTGASPFHTYTTPGFYTVWLIVWDDGGTAASDIIVVTVNNRPFVGTPNEGPEVDAGPDQHLDCNVLPCSTALAGTAYDPDDYPSPLIIEWILVVGPGAVTFDDPADPTTTARFSASGTYVLALAAYDGEVSVADQVQIIVEEGAAPGSPATGHHGGDSFSPLADCAACHGADLTGAAFGADWAPSCYDCHGPLWTPPNEPPTIDAGAACNPVAHWSLDEGSGLTVRDSSGNSHDATLVGSPQWVSGPAGFGGALSFNRVNYVEAPHEGDFDLTGEITVAAWANIERIDAHWSPIVAKGNSAWRLSTRADQKRFHFAVTGPADGSNWVNGNQEVELGQWHHVTGTYDGAQIRLYIDGVEDSASPVRYAGPISTNDFAVWIGGNAQFPGSGFFGRIDDVHIYDCALDSDDILSLMGASPSGPTMLVREVIDNGPIVDQDACLASLDSGAGTIVEYDAPVLNILDGGPHGHFGNDDSFGVVGASERALLGVDNLSLRAEGIIRIPARQSGPWTFGVNSDDGFTLQFPGFDFLSVVNGELANLSGGTALRFFGSRATADTLGTINLPVGDHPFWLTYHEGWGEAALEFYAARGAHTAFDPDEFRLVGQAGIDAAAPGLCEDVTMVATRPGAWSGGLVDSLADARAALAQGQSDGTNTLRAYTYVNHIDPDVGGPSMGSFTGDQGFPNHVPGVDDNDFAVKVTGLLDIPVAGTYQIGFNSDDGVSLRIHGRSWGSIVEDATGNAFIGGDELKNDSVTGWSFTAGEITLPAGCHSFEAVMFERGGGAFFELLGRGVSDQGVADPSWHLLRVGGARLAAPTGGLQLVPLK